MSSPPDDNGTDVGWETGGWEWTNILYYCKIDTTLNDATIVSPNWQTVDEFFYETGGCTDYCNPLFLPADQILDGPVNSKE